MWARSGGDSQSHEGVEGSGAGVLGVTSVPAVEAWRLWWNGRDESGRPVPAGTYFVTLRTTGPGGAATTARSRLVVLR
jgi:hypothetical protein